MTDTKNPINLFQLTTGEQVLCHFRQGNHTYTFVYPYVLLPGKEDGTITLFPYVEYSKKREIIVNNNSIVFHCSVVSDMEEMYKKFLKREKEETSGLVTSIDPDTMNAISNASKNI